MSTPVTRNPFRARIRPCRAGPQHRSRTARCTPLALGSTQGKDAVHFLGRRLEPLLPEHSRIKCLPELVVFKPLHSGIIRTCLRFSPYRCFAEPLLYFRP